jgi:choline dehydrogenase-like flavoprotein
MSDVMDQLVIGSGPSGISAAMALIAQGRRVTLVDVGLTLESERQARLDAIGSQPFESWDPAEVAKLKGTLPSDSSGVQVKLLYGSDYPYRDAIDQNGLSIPDGTFKPSHAQGGLSTVWGASVLPYNDRDLEGWPVSAADLDQHYRAVADWMPVMATSDDLAEQYPIHSRSPEQVRPSRQTRAMVDRMTRSRKRLTAAGMRFGYSRVAMRSRDCVGCGLCLYGCPYRLIYNTAETLARLKDNPNFRYVSGVRVDRVEENRATVSVSGQEVPSGRSWAARAERVFVGAGIVPTARIVLDSAEHYDRPLPILDSQYTLLPMLGLKTFGGIEDESLHTLCQLYLKIDDPALSRHDIHCQLYTYNDLFLTEFRHKAFGLLPLLPGARRQILSRLLVSLCYLHSDDSNRLSMTLSRHADESGKRMRIEFDINPRTEKIKKRLAWKLVRHARSLGFVPIVPMIQLAHPGRGYHSGGSFPMGDRSNGPQADVLGRPFGWRRIHLIDASVFPTIPSATITYTIMANAHRIATQAMQS